MAGADLILKAGSILLVLGVFGALLQSGAPDWVLAAGGFAVAAIALWLGLRLRKAE